jgi:AcrR family transcriptional regulator
VRSLSEASQPILGLRERKKAKTRAAIRDHALRLFRVQGYPETTVDQIAEAAEVSPSTFFRYFPTKEDVVLADDHEGLIVDAFRAQPPELGPIQAVRAAMRMAFEGLTEDVQAREREWYLLIRSVPELRSAMLEDYARSIRLLAELVAERMGRDPDDFQVKVFAGAMGGVAMTILETMMRDPRKDFVALLDDGFALLENGLPL